MQEQAVGHIIPKQFVMTLLFLLSSLTINAQESHFVPTVKGASIQFSPAPFFTRDSGVQLMVSGPNDFIFEHLFKANENLIFDAKNSRGQTLADGQYTYELTMVRLNGYRQSTPVDLEGKSNDSFRRNGTLTFLSGLWVSPDTEENGARRDQVFVDDLIVQGSSCIGSDCVNGESLDFDTLRLKENNLRIRFFDTSNSASFPSTDWELRANDTVNGGANKFSIADLDGNREIFAVEGGAPANSLLVDDRGRVGFGTSTPLLDLHVLSGNTPSSRFQQDGSGGFPSQTWDIGGNETEFFIRDFSNSQVPFRVRPGAPSDSLVINPAGDIEIGGSIITVPIINLPNRVLGSRGQTQLQDLSDVESHIKQHNQLPGIDNQSGDLIQLQLQLLEKVQELTLYTIEQDKRIAELEKKLLNSK